MGDEIDDQRCRRVIREIFSNSWKELFSLCLCKAEQDKLADTDLVGMHYLQGALENGRGVILWESNSFGLRARSKQILDHQGYRIHQLYGPGHLEGFLMGRDWIGTWMRRHITKPLMEKLEKRFLAQIVYLPRSDSLAFPRLLTALLKRNSIICIPADGTMGKKHLAVPFLGRPVFFQTGALSLARASGASILPIFCVEKKLGATCLVIEPPIQIDTSLGRDRGLSQSISQYAALLESYIRRYPEWYRGWGSQTPENEPRDAGY
jgi:lauroyl/myristoyl acyltransferase